MTRARGMMLNVGTLVAVAASAASAAPAEALRLSARPTVVDGALDAAADSSSLSAATSPTRPTTR